MRTILLTVLSLMVVACDPSTDPGAPVEPVPQDAIPYQRPWPTASDAVTSACSAMCRWDARCEAGTVIAACEADCYHDICDGETCESPPSGTDEQLEACVHYVWLEVSSQAPRCEIPRRYSSLCLDAFLP